MTLDKHIADIQERFKQEFGIHFSESELQFAQEFIKDEILKTLLEYLKGNITEV